MKKKPAIINKAENIKSGFSRLVRYLTQKAKWPKNYLIQAVPTLRNNFAKKVLVYNSVFTAQVTHTILARALCDETKILTNTETETFYPRQIFLIPIPRLLFRDQIFQDRYRDSFSETKFSDTDTETFLTRLNISVPIPRRFFSRLNFSIPRLTKKLSWVLRLRPRPRLLHMIDKF